MRCAAAQEAIKIDGINNILLAEQEADRIRAEAKSAVEAAFAEAEAYRSAALENARKTAASEAQRLTQQAEQRAEERRTELNAVTAVRLSELEQLADKRTANAVAWLAEQITEV